MLVRGDNQRALKLAENEEHHHRTKHIDVRFRFLRDVVEMGVSSSNTSRWTTTWLTL